MDIYHTQCDFLEEVINFSDSIADDSLMEWPFFSWAGADAIYKALQQLKAHCTKTQLIFRGANREKGESTFLYKLFQDKRPNLWCGIWIVGDEKIKSIKFIFDSYESFKNGNVVEIFGFKKVLKAVIHNTPENPANEEILKIVLLIQNFFVKKYGFPIQETLTAKSRLYQAATEANTLLKNSDKYTVILPFFSATEKGPLQFYATISKNNDSSYEII